MKNIANNDASIGPTEWLLFALIIAFGGSAFAMIRIAVETAPPIVIGAGRIWVGAIILYIVMRSAGRRFPPFFVRTSGKLSVRRSWRWMIAVGLVGNLIPFFIFPWAQQFVESGLAGIYMAFMPIWTIVLAYFFAGESLTKNKLIGFFLGFAGVIILMGPEAVKGVGEASFAAQASLLLATLMYASSAVITRKAPPIRPRIFSAGMMLVAAIGATPLLLVQSIDPTSWSTASILSIIGLGIFPTGINGVLIIILIRRAGAGFMAFSNYVTPIWAVAVGAMVFSERLPPVTFLALTMILLGVAISQRKQKTENIAITNSPAGGIAALSNEEAPLLDKDSVAADSNR